MNSNEFEGYLFRGRFFNGVTLEREGWFAYRVSNGMIIRYKGVNKEEQDDYFLLWETVKWEPLVRFKRVG